MFHLCAKKYRFKLRQNVIDIDLYIYKYESIYIYK